MKTRRLLLLGLALCLAGCPRPQFTQQPASQTVNPGTDVTISVAGTNLENVRWNKDGVVIPDANSQTLILESVTQTDEGSYQAAAKSFLGYVDSEVATLTVNDPAAVTADPISVTVAPGVPVTLSVTATGTEPLTYRWFRNGMQIPAPDGRELNLASARLIDIGNYVCEVNNLVDQPATSGPAMLRLTGFPDRGIALTVIPTYGTSEYLYGVAYGVYPPDFDVAVYNESTWGFYGKPFLATPLTMISMGDLDGIGSNFVCDVTTGSYDELALGYVAELLPKGVNPTLCMGNDGGGGGVPCPEEPDTPGAIAKCAVHRVEARSFEAFATTWNVKRSDFPTEPGNHPFPDDAAHSFVDADGNIHLISGEGTSVEIVSEQSFGYGTYIFQVRGLAEALDFNRTLGLFVHELLSDDPANREIDILEIGKWGNLLNPTNAQHVLQPCTDCPGCGRCNRFNLDETSDFTAYMVWSEGHIEMRTYQGNHLVGVPPAADLISQWTYDVAEVPVPSPNQKVRINLWLLTGKNPGQTAVQEVIITGFTHQQEIPWLSGVAPTVSVVATVTDIVIGQPAIFTATVTGTEPITYVWKRDGTELSGQTTATLEITSAQLNDTGDYICTVTNDFGSAESTAVHLIVSATDPLITLQPYSQTKNPGEEATFQVIASGGVAPLIYQWYKKVGTNASIIDGATSPTLTISGISENDQAGYFCRVANAIGPVKSFRVAKSS